jgi:hypothetical protein
VKDLEASSRASLKTSGKIAISCCYKQRRYFDLREALATPILSAGSATANSVFPLSEIMLIRAPMPQTEPVAPPNRPVEEPEPAPKPLEPAEPNPEPDPFEPDWPQKRPLPPPKARR